MTHLKTLLTALPCLAFVAGCADPEPVVRNPDTVERLAEYERVAEAATDEAGPQPRVAITDGPDFTREGENTSFHDRFERPTDTPMYRIPKIEQVGAVGCPDSHILGKEATNDGMPRGVADFDAWLLEEPQRGQKQTAGNVDYTVLMSGIERGYKPQDFDKVRLLVNGSEVETRVSRLDSFEGVVQAMTPCMVVAVKLSEINEKARGEFGIGLEDSDNIPDVVRLQLVQARDIL